MTVYAGERVYELMCENKIDSDEEGLPDIEVFYQPLLALNGALDFFFAPLVDVVVRESKTERSITMSDTGELLIWGNDVRSALRGLREALDKILVSVYHSHLIEPVPIGRHGYVTDEAAYGRLKREYHV